LAGLGFDKETLHVAKAAVDLLGKEKFALESLSVFTPIFLVRQRLPNHGRSLGVHLAGRIRTRNQRFPVRKQHIALVGSGRRNNQLKFKQFLSRHPLIFVQLAATHDKLPNSCQPDIHRQCYFLFHLIEQLLLVAAFPRRPPLYHFVQNYAQSEDVRFTRVVALL
jgi:hypothetical protein